MTWIDQFSNFTGLPAPVGDRLVAGSRRIVVPAGARVFEPGQPAGNMLVVLSGSVRVQQISDSGREVFLYRVLSGESCVLTTACMLEDETYPAEAIAETEVEAVTIPREVFDELVAQSKVFRSFVFHNYARRIADLFGLIDDIVFQRVDVRLAARLVDMATDRRVAATHQTLAVELGSAREVISRTLAEFQRRGWLETGRGEIRLLDQEALEIFARSVI